MNLDTVIRKVPDFPHKGILFYDITSVFMNSDALDYCTNEMIKSFPTSEIDGVIGVESRGFLMSALYAHKAKVPLVLARKAGKLPGETVSKSYALEYGEATLELHKSDIKKGGRYLIIDDLIATGGTLEATAEMVKDLGGTISGIFSIVGLPFLGYPERLAEYRTVVLQEYMGE